MTRSHFLSEKQIHLSSCSRNIVHFLPLVIILETSKHADFQDTEQKHITENFRTTNTAYTTSCCLYTIGKHVYHNTYNH